MARLIAKDFAKLEVFLNQYSLADVLKSKSREQLIKRGHKYCLAALQILATSEDFAKLDKLKIHGLNLAINSPHFNQFSESFSDLTSAYFAALHGLYKPAHMSLRSAIETFVRGLSGVEYSEAESTTSVYRLFELARDCKAFSGAAAQHLNSLHDEYAKLCNYTHSANAVHLVKNFAMSNFPKQDIEHLRKWVRHCETIIKSILSVLVLGNKSLYFGSAPSAQDVYEETIPKEVRLYVLGANKH